MKRVQINEGYYKGRYGVVVEEEGGYQMVALDGGDVHVHFDKSDLTEVPITLGSLCKGDVVVDEDEEWDVLKVEDQLVFYGFHGVALSPVTKQELKDKGYTVKGTTEPSPKDSWLAQGEKEGWIKGGKLN